MSLDFLGSFNPVEIYHSIFGPYVPEIVCQAGDVLCQYTGGEYTSPEFLNTAVHSIAETSGVSDEVALAALAVTSVAAVSGAVYGGKKIKDRRNAGKASAPVLTESPIDDAPISSVVDSSTPAPSTTPVASKEERREERAASSIPVVEAEVVAEPVKVVVNPAFARLLSTMTQQVRDLISTKMSEQQLAFFNQLHPNAVAAFGATPPVKLMGFNRQPLAAQIVLLANMHAQATEKTTSEVAKDMLANPTVVAIMGEGHGELAKAVEGAVAKLEEKQQARKAAVKRM